MKYTNLNSFTPTPGALVRYLESLGITNIDSFLYRPSPVDYETPWNLQNIEELIDRLHYHFMAGDEFFLQVDSDTDGYTSASEFYNFFTTLYPQARIRYRIHKGKEHGVIVHTVPKTAKVIIIPDAGSNQAEEIAQLTAAGKVVLIMDHHIINHPSYCDNCVVVNNQMGPTFHNKSLSGAGVVYKILQAYDEKYNGKKGLHKEFEDLAALGIVADAMDVRNLDNNAIIYNGFSNINNEMFKALLEQQKFSIKKPENPTKLDVMFYIAPLINATIRSGTDDEKQALFEGFITKGSTEIITTMSRGEERNETLYQFLARSAVNLRGRQNTQKEKSLNKIMAQIEDERLDRNKVLIVKTGAEDVPQNITGLVAMDISSIYKKPTLILRPVNEDGCIYYRGSGRATPVEGFDSFMDALLATNIMDYVEGHDNAFGASVMEDLIPMLTEELNAALSNVDFENSLFVHCCMDDENWNSTVIKEFAEAVPVFGQGIPQPVFHFDFQIKPSDFRIQGSRGDSLKFQYKGIVFVIFFAKDQVDKYLKLSEQCLKQKKEIHVECIGKASINEYKGYRNINITLDGLELSLCDPKVRSLF